MSDSLARFHAWMGPTVRREVGQCSAALPVAVHFGGLRESSMGPSNAPVCLVSGWVGREDLDEGALGVVNVWHFRAGSSEGPLQEALLEFAVRLWGLRLAGYEGICVNFSDRRDRPSPPAPSPDAAEEGELRTNREVSHDLFGRTGPGLAPKLTHMGYEGDPLASIHEARLRDVLEREAYRRTEPRANVEEYEFPEPLFASRDARISAMIADRTRLTGGYWGWFGHYCLQRADNPKTEEQLRLHVDATERAPVEFPAFLVASGVTAACFWHELLF